LGGAVLESLAGSVSLSFAREAIRGTEGVSMSDRDQLSQVGGEQERAAQRLDAAVEEQSRARGEREHVSDTRDEVAADAAVHAADEKVLARERWLSAVDDHDY
jgi:hypothetical protein